MKKILISITLAAIAFILFIILAPFGIVYGVGASFVRVKIGEGFQKIGGYFKSIAISIDQTGNVFCKELFNDVLISPKGHQFGNEDETISSVLGKNKLNNTLTWAGKLLDAILNIFEKDHSVISIEHDE
jgi:hypothetical protein